MARGEPEFRVRLPVEMLEWLRQRAAANRRTMTGEVQICLMQVQAADQASRATGAPVMERAS